MLTDSIKTEIRDSLKKISQALPGFRSREGQRAMIAEIARTLACHPDPPKDPEQPREVPTPGTTIACVQGGTGVGKSLGYALPAAILAKHKGKRLVIATATVALQEQLVQKDLPLFFRAAGLDKTVELAKGRSRYVCAYRLRQAVDDMQQMTMFEPNDRPGSLEKQQDDEALRKSLESLLEDFHEGRWDGDRDKRHGINDELWRTLTTDRHGCLGMNCPSLRKCAQVEAKKRLKASDIIVANHDLVLADLAMGGGKILPAPADCFYIIDEAHQFPEKAVSAFASSHLLDVGRKTAERIDRFADSLGRALGVEFRSEADQMGRAATLLENSLRDAYAFFDSLAQLKPTEKKPEPILEMEQSCIPEEFFDLGTNILSATKTILDHGADALKRMGTAIEQDPGRKPALEKLITECGYYTSKVVEIDEAWKLFLEEHAEGHPPIAKWISTVRIKGGFDYQVNASPVRAANFLINNLWNRAAGVILTSATLKTLGNFNDFLGRTGLHIYRDVVRCIDVPSPFDYARQGTIEIPQMRALPANYAEHTREVGEWVSRLCANATGGMLVLFTSKRQMNDVFKALPPEIAQLVQVQGADSKGAIIKEHLRRIDAGERSAIFGLESFAEGVDLAGKYCTRVVVTKLPFDVPDDPVLKALSGWIEGRGGRPFNEIFVPSAARKLEQRAGRLIRTESDSGEVIVLDMRLSDTAYGKQMLRGLPPFRLLIKGKETTL